MKFNEGQIVRINEKGPSLAVGYLVQVITCLDGDKYDVRGFGPDVGGGVLGEDCLDAVEFLFQ